jgi:hypothetical protein
MLQASESRGSHERQVSAMHDQHEAAAHLHEKEVTAARKQLKGMHAANKGLREQDTRQKVTVGMRPPPLLPWGSRAASKFHSPAQP